MTAEDTEANKQLTSVQMRVWISALTIQILLPVMYFTMFLGTLTISNLSPPQPESVSHEGVLYRLPYCSLVHHRAWCPMSPSWWTCNLRIPPSSSSTKELHYFRNTTEIICLYNVRTNVVIERNTDRKRSVGKHVDTEILLQELRELSPSDYSWAGIHLCRHASKHGEELDVCREMFPHMLEEMDMCRKASVFPAHPCRKR